MQDIFSKIRKIFEDEKAHIECIDTGYANTNNIYSVSSKDREYILKIPNLKDNYLYWKGIEYLFGLNLIGAIENQKSVSEYIKEHGTIKVPKVIESDVSSDNALSSPYIIQEKMFGKQIKMFSDLEQQVSTSSIIAFQLGEHIGSMYSSITDVYGALVGDKNSLINFHGNMRETMKKLALSSVNANNTQVQEILPYYLSELDKLETPTKASLIMPDLWPSQFLFTADKLSACVDIESYVIAPVELELILIEIWLEDLTEFKEGYFTVNNHWPDLEDCREVYRFFLFLLYGSPSESQDYRFYNTANFPKGGNTHKRSSKMMRPRPRGYPGLNR